MSPDKVLHCPECGEVTVNGFCAACCLQVEEIKAHKVEQKPKTDVEYMLIRLGVLVLLFFVFVFFQSCGK